MKLRYYMDLWPGLDPLRYPPMVMATPGAKSTGALRLAFDLTIPDHLLHQVDAVLPEAPAPVIVADRESEERQP